jgi:H+-transporting ATPase
VYAGALVDRGEATGVVQRTGSGTLFGRTAELVRTARAPGHLERLIVGVVRWLVALDVVLVVAVVGYGLARDLPARELLPFTLILIIASVPVALPATFTLATTLGSRELSARGVLVTRLAAIEDAAAMTVVCTDKTGTITQNRLSVTELLPYPPYQAGELLRYGALASEAATQDPLDMAVLAGAPTPACCTPPRAPPRSWQRWPAATPAGSPATLPGWPAPAPGCWPSRPTPARGGGWPGCWP